MNLEKPQLRTPRLGKSSPEKYKQPTKFSISIYISSESNGLGLLTFIFHFFHVIFLKQKLISHWTRIFTFLQGSVLYLRPEKKTSLVSDKPRMNK